MTPSYGAPSAPLCCPYTDDSPSRYGTPETTRPYYDALFPTVAIPPPGPLFFLVALVSIFLFPHQVKFSGKQGLYAPPSIQSPSSSSLGQIFFSSAHEHLIWGVSPWTVLGRHPHSVPFGPYIRLSGPHTSCLKVLFRFSTTIL